MLVKDPNCLQGMCLLSLTSFEMYGLVNGSEHETSSALC